MTAGDDYEILAAVPADKLPTLPNSFTVIGRFAGGRDVAVHRRDGSRVEFSRTGWDHF